MKRLNQKLNPVLDKLDNWLQTSTIRNSNGSVLSWINGNNNGYPYNEITGYYIKYLCYIYEISKDSKLLDIALESARFLFETVDGKGRLGRDGISYVFDTAMCISGLIKLANYKDYTQFEREKLLLMCDFVYNSLKKGHTAFELEEPINDNNRWSLSFGSLHLKTIVSMHEAYRFTSIKKYKKISDVIYKKVVEECFSVDHFTINSKRDWVYTHPHCYASEGLIYFSQYENYKGTNRMLSLSSDWLQKNQNTDGSLFNWYNNSVDLDKQGDATSQAVRIWLCSNPDRYKKNINKAIYFLTQLQSDDGGIYYNKGSDDINSWVSMFFSQSLHFLLEGPSKKILI